ncbi:DUF1330 domain-containing protein [Pantoea sp. PNT02]|jgi:uncharacterized protein (DUF1330 family)|uniref:DUF1330 domain-containing protein n=1 Tax=Pantoea TaxID=53335 RepID=UPI000D9D9258|nr:MULTISPECIES: DUF1330 domain-containing protein [Pantoea]MBD9644185.1 DUF1330 domain-containing protein [Pantoea sp. PNT02]MBY4839057.1 DUF1330 domain-containing protein [Pantoea sp. DY-5]MBY4889444.1 DUF1330 domain-containing protein [Pantoea sp. DY-15]PYG46895.1 uncharacterized protein (DUF1330 family) [Pantoea sp. AG1095]QCP58231.1 DUF1330 domain-containing protein [Pantoea sp. SO10]
MAAYVVFIKDETLDQDEMATYAEKAGQARGDHPITPLAFYGALETLEGPEAEGVVVLEFPDAEAAKGWYFSPAYQEAKAHRLKGAKYRVLLVNGVE